LENHIEISPFKEACMYTPSKATQGKTPYYIIHVFMMPYPSHSET
jgi:hypothetical protein